MARKLAERYPQIPVTILHSGEPPWMNARCYSMHLMAKAAKHDLLVATDADIPVGPEYLREMVAPFRDPQVGAALASIAARRLTAASARAWRRWVCPSR